MAGIILLAKQVQSMIDELRPVVDEWVEGMLERNQVHTTELYRALDAAHAAPSPEEREASIAHIMEKRNAWRKWPFHPGFNRAQAEQEYKRLFAHEAIERIEIANMRFEQAHKEQDRITPVLNYLEALMKMCDPEAEIVLSDNETFQLQKGFEIHHEKNRDAGHESGLSKRNSPFKARD